MTQLAIRTVHEIAVEIKSIETQTYDFVLRSSIDVGKRLTEAKELLPHGEWANWLNDHVDYSQSKANNLMNVYKEYGNTNSQAIANLPLTHAQLLISIPAEEREQFVEENKVDTVSSRELQKMIKDKKDLEKKLKDSRALADQERLERERLSKSLEEMERQNNNHYELAESYKKQIEEANAIGNDGEAARLQEALSKSEKELADKLKAIKKLEAELKKKPIEVPATVTIEKVPEAIENELAELRTKVSKQADAEVKIRFEALGKCFQELLSSIAGMSEEEKVKCKSAAKALINKMIAEL